jgi:antitoxin ParD1/3/4
MTSMTLTLPESLKTFVEQQAVREGYDSADAYIRTLIREAQESVSDDEVEGKLLEALESGPASPMTTEDWDGIRSEVHRKHAAFQGNSS